VTRKQRQEATMKTLVSGIVSIDEKIQDEARDGFYVASQNVRLES